MSRLHDEQEPKRRQKWQNLTRHSVLRQLQLERCVRVCVRVCVCVCVCVMSVCVCVW